MRCRRLIRQGVLGEKYYYYNITRIANCQAIRGLAPSSLTRDRAKEAASDGLAPPGSPSPARDILHHRIVAPAQRRVIANSADSRRCAYVVLPIRGDELPAANSKIKSGATWGETGRKRGRCLGPSHSASRARESPAPTGRPPAEAARSPADLPDGSGPAVAAGQQLAEAEARVGARRRGLEGDVGAGRAAPGRFLRPLGAPPMTRVNSPRGASPGNAGHLHAVPRTISSCSLVSSRAQRPGALGPGPPPCRPGGGQHAVRRLEGDHGVREAGDSAGARRRSSAPRQEAQVEEAVGGQAGGRQRQHRRASAGQRHHGDARAQRRRAPARSRGPRCPACRLRRPAPRRPRSSAARMASSLASLLCS